MKKRNVKAFTVVELVIVIAVIAVLAAVMIPTFGALIEKANISADEAEITSLNTQLAIMDITSEADLYNAIVETYGEDVANKFAPRSAKYGYHYWYDTYTNTVILKTYSELDVSGSGGSVERNDHVGGIAFLSTVPLVDKTPVPEFAHNTVYRMFYGRYFILDKGGSIIGDALKAIEEGSQDVADKLDALKADNISALAPTELKEMAAALLEKVQQYVYISNDTIFVANADDARDIIFTSDITTIPTKSASLNYIATVAKISQVKLPSTVESVEESSLWFDVANTVKLRTEFTKEQIIDVFKANSTNAIILDKDGNEYTVDGASLKDDQGTSVGSLKYSNKVTSFELVCPSGNGFKYLGGSEEKILYVAHSESDFVLTPDNFETEGEGSLVDDVIWSAEGAISVNADGRVTLNAPEKFEGDNSAYVGKVTATSVTSEAKVEIEIRVVTMMSATISVGTNQLSLDNTEISNAFTLTYDGTPETAEYAIGGFASTYNYSVDVKCCTSVTPTFTLGTGNLFTIENGKLTLNTEAENLNGTQAFTVKVGNHIEKTFTVTVVDNSATTFEKVFANTDSYLYRVGNSNTITLGQLFSSTKPGENISVAIYDATVGESKTIDELVSNHLKATYTKTALTADTWAASTIKFSGTGVAIIKITNDAGSQTVIVEVVDGYNVTAASQLKSNANNILLNDIKLASGGKWSLTGDANNHKTLYGNGFTFDITEATSQGNGIITLSNADIDNIKIVGSVYETYADTHGTAPNLNNYYASAVLISSGSSRISNSYIFGCRSNIRTAGNLEIVNSVVECARLSNINVTAGTLTIDGLITINEPNASNKNVVGLGIMIGTDAASTTKIVIKGDLKQYNWVCESDESYLPNMTGMSTLVDKIFAQTKYLHTIDGVKYANMGIAGLNGNIPTSAVTFSDPYEAQSLSLLTYNGFVVSPSDAKYDATTSDLVYRNQAYTWTPTTQDNTVPTIKWSNYNADVTFEKGQSFEFNPNVLTATKHGNTLTPTVTINGVDYTGKTIKFTADQTCTIKYTIKDPYAYDANGNVIAAKEYVYYLVVNVTTTDPAIKAPEFSFTGATGFTTVDYNGKTYVVPTGNTSDTSKFYNVGNGIYAPIVTVQIKDGSSDFTGYYPIFGGVSITWYDGAGNATTYNSSSNLSAMPEGLEWLSDVASLKGATTDWDGFGKYSSYGLCKISKPDGSTNSSDTYKTVEFSFQAEGTEKYYYYIRFKEPAHNKPSGCVTADTLVTLIDGTQKEIQYVTNEDMLLTWNHFTGEYQAVPAAIIFNHGYANNTVIKLNFSDGTQVKVINLHQFLDVDLNKYVTINSDTVADYVGHSFAKQSGDSYTTVTLESYEISEEYIEAYGIISALNYNIFVEGMLSTDFMEQDYDLFNYFTLGEDLVYDAEQMQKDIEEYGLYTYEEFADYLTYEQFVGFNVQYFKISVGKGNYTYEKILELIDTYLG